MSGRGGVGRPRPGRALAALLAGVALALAACTGVPGSSAPEVIEPVHISSAGPSISPTPGELPLALLQGFVNAMAADPTSDTSARSFLTPSARVQWSDTTVTIIDNRQFVPYDPHTGYVGVTGEQVAQLSATGVYTPTLPGQESQYQFHVTQVDGQYRIDKLPAGLGLLLTEDQFRAAFHQYPIYFYDLNDKYLVPDYRWTALADLTDLVQWEVSQLVAGPRQSMQNTVSTDTLPSGLNSLRIDVTAGSPMQIEIPGSSQLAGDVRDKLAAQLCQLVAAIQSSGPVLEITDNKVPVEIPSVRSPEFTEASFPSQGVFPASPPVAVYYLANSGRIYTATGSLIAGPLGLRPFVFDSIALHPSVGAKTPSVGAKTPPDQPAPVLVAGVAGSDDILVVGSQGLGVQETRVRDVTSRPSFAPGTNEVWVGVGRTLERVTITGQTWTAATVLVQSPSGPLGTIKAVRISPEGARIALVVAGPNDSTQLYLGSVVRQNNQVHVQGLTLLSPPNVVLQDVGWSDSRRLVAVGYDGASQNQRIFDVGVDGSEWTATSTSLAGALDSVTVAPSQTVWVSTVTDGVSYVWQETAQGWRGPVKGQTPGSNPVYVE